MVDSSKLWKIINWEEHITPAITKKNKCELIADTNKWFSYKREALITFGNSTLQKSQFFRNILTKRVTNPWMKWLLVPRVTENSDAIFHLTSLKIKKKTTIWCHSIFVMLFPRFYFCTILYIRQISNHIFFITQLLSNSFMVLQR